MSSESGDRRPHPPPKLAEPLPCPRCNSTNTKFCYYNNYNLSQPRHFCKACRRYWTHGGTLRNVPVGGGTRKNSKRSHSSSTSTSTSSSSTNTSASALSILTHDTEVLRLPPGPDQVLPVVKGESSSHDLNLNDNLPGTENGNIISLLNSTQQGTGLMGMVGYGPNFGYGFCEMGVGYGGIGSMACPGMGYIGGGDVQGGNSGWQVGDGSEEAAGPVDGDCFSWPGLAISTPGKGFK